MKKWRVFITSAAERAIDKLPEEIQGFVFKEFPILVMQNPLIGQPLSGPLAWLRSFHFSVGGKPYRVAYGLDTKSSKIYIHYVGYRGEFYERLRRLLGY